MARPPRTAAHPAGRRKRKPAPRTAFTAGGALPPQPPTTSRLKPKAASLRGFLAGTKQLPNQRKDVRSMTKAKDKLLDRTGSARPYIERAITDEDVRDNIRNAFESAREVYNELLGGRGAIPLATRVATDKDIQDRLREAIDELREAADRVQGKQEHGARNTTLLMTGIALGILFNPLTGSQTRKWLSDRLFGSPDEFTYQGGNSGASSSN